MSGTTSRVSPIVAIAAASVIIFSAVGVGVMTGIIPSSISRTGDEQAKAEPAKAALPAPTAEEQPRKAVAAAPKKRAEQPARVASAEPARTRAAPKICANCGSVVSVDVVKHQGEGSGLGAIGGAVVGGVLGNQVGSGSGRRVATVAGAAGGAYAGHQIEKHVKSTQSYNVAVHMEDGSNRTFSYDAEPGFRVGDKVKVVDGRLAAN